MKTADTLRIAVLVLSAALLLGVSLSSFGFAERAEKLEPAALPTFQKRCDVSREAAAERAASSDTLAEAAIARYPFAARDGLRALAALATAGGCHALAGEADAAARAERRAARWRTRIERDYRDHVVRYERATAQGRPALARADIAFLLELLALHESPFVSALRRQELQLDASSTPETKP